MRAISKLTLGLMFSALGAPCLHSEDDPIAASLARLDSPFAEERADGKAELIAHQGDVSRQLRKAMADAPECVQAELLDVVLARRDAALVEEAALLLGTNNARLTPAAREYLLVLDSKSLSVDSAKLGNGAKAWDEFLAFRRRYQICGALLEAQFKPGKFTGQFEDLRSEGGAQLDADLLMLAAPSEAFCEALNEAASDRFEKGLQKGDYVRTARFRRLANAELLSLALAMVARGSLDEELQQRVTKLDTSTLAAALYAVQELRVAAIRALALTPNPDDTADKLAAFYVQACRDQQNDMLKRLLDQDSLKEEVEVTLARFGRPELLESRITNLRKRYDAPTTGQAAVASKSAGDVETQTRSNIAYLYLRAGDAATAEIEWAAAIEQVNARLNATNGRTRSALAVQLGAIYYNLACAQSRQNKSTKALGSLGKAVENGYVEFGWILEDGDLESLRDTKAFVDWFSRVAPPSLVDNLPDRR
jgi:hypothetical protein